MELGLEFPNLFHDMFLAILCNRGLRREEISMGVFASLRVGIQDPIPSIQYENKFSVMAVNPACSVRVSPQEPTDVRVRV